MPNVNRGSSLFLGSAQNPDSVSVALSSPAVPGSNIPYAPGDLGVTFEYQDKAYTVVILDSGATSANTVGAPAANMLLFWKNKANRIVTNDYRQSIAPTAPGVAVAGVLRNTPAVPLGTGGNLICMMIRGYGVTVKAGTCAIGAIMANTSANTASAVTATTTLQQIGQALAADSAGTVLCNIDIPQLP